MKVIDERTSNTITIEDINAGEVFQKGAFTYLKLKCSIRLNSHDLPVNAVRLEDGELVDLASSCLVERCNAELILK